jgi:hypothetical protein
MEQYCAVPEEAAPDKSLQGFIFFQFQLQYAAAEAIVGQIFALPRRFANILS